MDVAKIPAGKNPSSDINVVIEVPQNSPGIKYELDKDSNAIFVDRFLATPMHYPCNYGFIPNTLSGDGDPVDVLVVGQYPIFPGAVIRSRPIGVLVMEDEGGEDEKILAVPVSKMTPYYDNIQEASDLPQILLDQIKHFFEHYKDLEKGKWVKVTGWKDAKTAGEMILDGVKRAN